MLHQSFSRQLPEIDYQRDHVMMEHKYWFRKNSSHPAKSLYPAGPVCPVRMFWAASMQECFWIHFGYQRLCTSFKVKWLSFRPSRGYNNMFWTSDWISHDARGVFLAYRDAVQRLIGMLDIEYSVGFRCPTPCIRSGLRIRRQLHGTHAKTNACPRT